MGLELITPSAPVAPALIGLLPKSRFGPSDETRAIKACIRAARGVDQRLPVIHGNKIVAWVEGSSWHRDVKVWMIGGIDQLINAATVNGQTLSQNFTFISSGASFNANEWWDLWPVGGGDYSGTAFTSRQFTDTTAGAIPHGGNVSPKTKVITSAYIVDESTIGVYMLYDRVLSYEACDMTGALKNLTNSLAAQRYIGAGQPGLRIMSTVQLSLLSSNLTALSYTNQAGTAGQAMPTGTTISTNTPPGSPVTGTTAAAMGWSWNGGVGPTWILLLPMATGDTGVQSIQSYTTSSLQASSPVAFVLVHPIAFIPTPAAGTGGQYDLVRQLPVLERIFDGACLSFAINMNTSGGSFVQPMGAVDFIWA
jgi:hypothetical protein